jgi:hypothetical protein
MARQLGYRAFAHHVLARFSALIVGFGLSDPDFEDLLQSFEANDRDPRSIGRPYAIPWTVSPWLQTICLP